MPRIAPPARPPAAPLATPAFPAFVAFLVCIACIAVPARPAGAASARPLPYSPHAGFPVDANKAALEGFAKPAAVQAESLHDFDALHYRLDLTFPCSGRNLSGTCALTLRSMVPSLATVTLDFAALNLDSVSQDGVAAGAVNTGAQLVITLPTPVALGDSTTVKVTYHGPASRGYFQAYPETWFTFSEPGNARYWFPCYDQPWDKATSEIHATVPDTMFVSSNGVQLAPPDSDSPRHLKTYHWGTTYPIATYLMSVAVGHYVELEGSALGVPLRSYVLKADSLNASYDFENVPDMINWFGSLWGQFPFENYGMSATKDFGGGMEHQTRTTITRGWLTGTRSYEWAIAHELAHQWWGDMVTCLTWDNTWLNEGFASYSDIMYTEHAYGADQARARLQDWASQYFDEESTSSYPLYAPPAAKQFGLTIYYKGAWALHMLRHVMGDSAFIGGWRDYGQAHRYGGSTVAEFQAAMEARYGSSLSWFFDPWVYGTGYPVLSVGRSATPRATGGYFNYLTVAQLQPGSNKFRMPVDMVLHSGGRDTTVTVWIGSSVNASQFTMAAPVDSVTVDPGGWLLYRGAGGGTVTDTGLPAAARPTPRIARTVPGLGVVQLDCVLPAASEAGPRTLEVFDVAGRRVATLWRGTGVEGSLSVRWSGALGERAGSVGGAQAPPGPAPSGMYFARLTAGGRSASAKVLLIR